MSENSRKELNDLITKFLIKDGKARNISDLEQGERESYSKSFYDIYSRCNTKDSEIFNDLVNENYVPRELFEIKNESSIIYRANIKNEKHARKFFNLALKYNEPLYIISDDIYQSSSVELKLAQLNKAKEFKQYDKFNFEKAFISDLKNHDFQTANLVLDLAEKSGSVRKTMFRSAIETEPYKIKSSKYYYYAGYDDMTYQQNSVVKNIQDYIKYRTTDLNEINREHPLHFGSKSDAKFRIENGLKLLQRLANVTIKENDLDLLFASTEGKSQIEEASYSKNYESASIFVNVAKDNKRFDLIDVRKGFEICGKYKPLNKKLATMFIELAMGRENPDLLEISKNIKELAENKHYEIANKLIDIAVKFGKEDDLRKIENKNENKIITKLNSKIEKAQNNKHDNALQKNLEVLKNAGSDSQSVNFIGIGRNLITNVKKYLGL